MVVAAASVGVVVIWLEYLLKGGIVTVGALAAVCANGLIRSLLSAIDKAAASEVDQTRARLGLAQAQQQLPGGRFVGMFERLATYLCLVTGFPAGIAFVLGVKGLGRYADLVTEPKEQGSRRGELFIIGTFASLLWASAWGLLVAWAVRVW